VKIDLKKAYDSVFWEVVQEILDGLHFPSLFITWIMACITTPTFTIQLNGRDHGSFKGKRGLRQGDPLSPLLFVLVMEYLSRLFQRATTKPGFKFHPQCRINKMVHMMFADDLIVFSAADRLTVHELMLAFEKFSKCSGLKANKDKS